MVHEELTNNYMIEAIICDTLPPANQMPRCHPVEQHINIRLCPCFISQCISLLREAGGPGSSSVNLAGAVATRYLRRHNAREHMSCTHTFMNSGPHASQGKLHTFVNVRVSARNIDVVRDNATCAFEAHLPHVSDVPQATFRRCNTDIIHFIANRYLSVSVLAKSATRHHFQVRSYAFCM